MKVYACAGFDMSSIPATHVIQVTNVAPAATIDQMKELFGYLGRIRNIRIYPTENYLIEPQSKVCYIEYYEKWSVGVAQHLTNTVFIDRALIVVPIADEGIPSESTALTLTNPSSALPGLVSSGPNALINEISGVDGNLVITTTDPKLTQLGLPQYPPLPANLDPVKIEEIRRTLTIGNFDPSVPAESLLKFINQIGEVKFLRMGGDGMQSNRFAFVEFTDQSSVPKVLQYNGITYEGRPLTINHSTTAIMKPMPKSSETAQKEIEEAMKRVREAQSLITAAIEPELPEERKKSRKSRSRSRSRRRSSSRSRRKRRSRSRSKRSRSRQRSSRSHRQSRTPPRQSKYKSRSKSRERKKETSSPRHKKESRSHSRERKKEVSSPHHKKERSRTQSRDRRKEASSPCHKKERSRSRDKKKETSSPCHKKERDRSLSRDRKKEVSNPHHKKESSRSQSRDGKKELFSSRHKKEESRSLSRDGKKEVSSPHHKKERNHSLSRDSKKEMLSPHHTKERSCSQSRDRKKVCSPHHKKERNHSLSRDQKKEVSSPCHKKERSRSLSRDRKKKLSSPHHKKERSCSPTRDMKKEISSPHHKTERSRSPSLDRKKEMSSPCHNKERSCSESRDRSNRHKSKSCSPLLSSSKSKSRKLKRPKENVERNREGSPKVENSTKKETSSEIQSGSYHKEIIEISQLYGPSLPVPEINSYFLQDSKSHEQKFDSDMSLSPASPNTGSIEMNQNSTNDIAIKEHSFVKNVSDVSEGRYQNSYEFTNLDYHNVELGNTVNTSEKIMTSDNTGVVLNKGLDSAYNMYFNMARDDILETGSRIHPDDSHTEIFEEKSVCGTFAHQAINPAISINESTLNEDFVAELLSSQRVCTSSDSKNVTSDISELTAHGNVDTITEASVISTSGLPSNKVEKDSSNFPVACKSREKTISNKSSLGSDKYQPSRSRSRSPIQVKRNKYQRTRSRSMSKESSYSHKNKSRSVSKHRSRSRSHKRSRSRSKGSNRKTRSPSRHHRVRDHSRSPSSKRDSYSPGRHSDSRRRKSSKRHSISFRKRSLTPKRKSRTSRRHSPTPHHRSRSPKHRSRSPSYNRSRSPQRSRTQYSPSRSCRAASRSPRRHSSSPSPADISMSGQRKSKKDDSRDKESGPSPSFHIDSANIELEVTPSYDEGYNLQRMMGQKENEQIDYIPSRLENYNCGYNSGDMDLASD